MNGNSINALNSIVDLLPRQAKALGDHVVLVDRARGCSFSQLFDRVHGLSHALNQRLVFGDRVAILMKDRIEHAVAYLACLNVGLIPVQLYPHRSASFVQRAITSTQAKLLFVDTHTLAVADELQGIECATPSSLAPAAGVGFWGERRNEVGTLLFTSGATGPPKGVILSQRALIACGTRNVEICELSSGSRELTWQLLGGTYHTGALHAHMMVGGQLIGVAAEPGPDGLLELLATVERERITHLHLRPTLLAALLREHPRALREHGRGLRLLGTGWVPISADTISGLIDALPNTRICMIYGMTESSRSAFNHFDKHPDKLERTGRAPADGELRIHAPDAQGRGELQARGSTVMSGYWQDEAATRRRIDEDGWVRTGDLATIDPQGYVQVLGRVDDMVNVDGCTFFPSEVEQILETHPAVRACAVAAAPDPATFHVAVAVVVARQGGDPALAQQLAAHVHAKSGDPRKVPSRLAFVDELPLNHLGKIRRPEVIELVNRHGLPTQGTDS